MAASLNGSKVVNGSRTADIVARAQALFDDLSFAAAREWKAADARSQGRRLHADLRAARDHSRCRHAAARHRRRRRSARGHPRRRLLPELYLPHPALDHRARRLRSARFRRRHAVPVDLRRDPQSLRHVEDDVSERLRALFRRAAELPGRHRRELLRQRAGRAARTTSASSAASRSATTSCAGRSRSINENRRLVRELYAFRARAPVAGTRRRGLSRAARRPGAAGRRTYDDDPRLSGCRRDARSGRGATIAASC